MRIIKSILGWWKSRRARRFGKLRETVCIRRVAESDARYHAMHPGWVLLAATAAAAPSDDDHGDEWETTQRPDRFEMN